MKAALAKGAASGVSWGTTDVLSTEGGVVGRCLVAGRAVCVPFRSGTVVGLWAVVWTTEVVDGTKDCEEVVSEAGR